MLFGNSGKKHYHHPQREQNYRRTEIGLQKHQGARQSDISERNRQMKKSVHLNMPSGKIFSQKYYQHDFGCLNRRESEASQPEPSGRPLGRRADKEKNDQKQNGDSVKKYHRVRIIFEKPIINQRRAKHQRQADAERSDLLSQLGRSYLPVLRHTGQLQDADQGEKKYRRQQYFIRFF